uniref:Uncharacterized protein n=1 Tax=Panagrolaimus davidi TaxID=227884 RepID=A0A914PQE8_9BILA
MRRSARIAALTSNSTSISASTKPNRKRKAEEVSTIVSIKQLHFHGSYIRQNWPFRDSLINYITKNPSNAKAWTKLIQSCKYFFAKNPVFVIDKLGHESNGWTAFLNGIQKSIDFTKISSKLWITEKFDGFNALNPPKNVSWIIPKLYKCDAKYLGLVNDVISYEDFLFLSSNLEEIILYKCIVKKDNGSIVPLEKLVQVLPKIKSILFCENFDETSITSNIVKELLELQHFSKIDKFELQNIPEIFDIETFFTYLKKNKHTKFTITFVNSISETYKNRLKEIVDEIIETEKHDYKIPNIYFGGINIEKWEKLLSIFYKH